MNMKKKLFLLSLLLVFLAGTNAQTAEDVRYLRRPAVEDMPAAKRKTIFINEQITTHIVMPEVIKLVDISTGNVVGNQVTDNIVRLKPAAKLMDNEIAAIVTLIGERHLVQYNLVYKKALSMVSTLYKASYEDMESYQNPDVDMSRAEMEACAWKVFNTRRQFYNIRNSACGMTAQVNNIFSAGDYFFIDFSLRNRTNIPYDINDVRVKLVDKKDTKAANSQSVELTPVYTLNEKKRFRKDYRQVLVLKKLTFPDEKVLRIEVSEDQISGRVIDIPIEYSDILNADSFDVSSQRLSRQAWTEDHAEEQSAARKDGKLKARLEDAESALDSRNREIDQLTRINRYFEKRNRKLEDRVSSLESKQKGKDAR
jgi:conjugative transposon TraN protein